MSQHTHVNIGGMHICANGLQVRNGQTFTPTLQELRDFGDKFRRIQPEDVGVSPANTASRVVVTSLENLKREGQDVVPPVAPSSSLGADGLLPGASAEKPKKRAAAPSGTLGDDDNEGAEDLEAIINSVPEMTLTELRALAADRDIELAGLKGKDAVVAAIQDGLREQA